MGPSGVVGGSSSDCSVLGSMVGESPSTEQVLPCTEGQGGIWLEVGCSISLTLSVLLLVFFVFFLAGVPLVILALFGSFVESKLSFPKNVPTYFHLDPI